MILRQNLGTPIRCQEIYAAFNRNITITFVFPNLRYRLRIHHNGSKEGLWHRQDVRTTSRSPMKRTAAEWSEHTETGEGAHKSRLTILKFNPLSILLIEFADGEYNFNLLGLKNVLLPGISLPQRIGISIVMLCASLKLRLDATH